ncbi:growth hormone secretagogue receptor type 1-like [Lineus longissimus]|uniref:growth hormone secretagogue receptor type 1-like n=1 Tax=Lineus longissimus TaxID=88925 RepID=UPI00315CFFE8
MNDMTTLEVALQEEFPFLRNIFVALTRYVWSVPVCFGIPGNILTIIVANRKHNRRVSPCIYMTAMAVVDTIFLLDLLWFYSIFNTGQLDGITTKATRGIMARVHGYMILTCSSLSGLFLSGMSVDRFVAVRFPMAAKGLCTPRRAKLTISAMILLMVINVHLFFVYKYVEYPSSGVRMLLYDVPIEIEKTASLFSVLVGTVCPFTIILGSNLGIIITLWKASINRRKLKATAGANQEEGKETGHLTVMLMFVSLAYVVTTLPFRVFDPIMELPELAAIYDMTQQYWQLRFGIGTFALANIWFFNYAVNFYLYCIFGGRRYRNDAKEVLHSILWCRKSK